MQGNNFIKSGLALMLLTVVNTGNASNKAFFHSGAELEVTDWSVYLENNASDIQKFKSGFNSAGKLSAAPAVDLSKGGLTRQANLWLLNANKPERSEGGLVEAFADNALAFNSEATHDVMDENKWLVNWSVDISNLVKVISVHQLKGSFISAFGVSDIIAAAEAISAFPLSSGVWIFLTALMAVLATRRKHPVLGIVA